MNNPLKKAALAALMICAGFAASAQKYQGVVDRTAAIVGGEMITLSDIEEQVQAMRAQGMASDRNMRCEVLESLMQAKLLITQARVDSLTVNQDNVAAQLDQYVAQTMTMLGGEEETEEYFG